MNNLKEIIIQSKTEGDFIMTQLEALGKVEGLLRAKEKIKKNIAYIKADSFHEIESIEMRTEAYNAYFIFGHNDRWINRERVWGKLKYILLAEMEETLQEINTGINKLVIFKEEK